MVSEKILTEITKRLVDGFQPDRIILFGSQARGTADAHSDVDILVVQEAMEDRRALTLSMYRDLKGLGISKGIIVLTLEEFRRDCRIPGTIARPAWLLYERS